MPQPNNIVPFALMLTLFACGRIKQNGDALVDKTKQAAGATKQTITDRANNLVDKVFPAYDTGKADTDNNKKRFQEHLQVDLTSDVKNIYAYGDFMGADYKVLLSFTCDTATLHKIVKAKKMTISTADNDDGLLFSEEFTWWNKKVIENIQPYKVGKENEYWQYVWFDKKTKTAYYEAFSL